MDQGRDTHEGVQSKEGALLLLKEPPRDQDTDSLCMWNPSIVTVTFPGARRWGQAGWILSAEGPGCTQGPGHPAP